MILPEQPTKAPVLVTTGEPAGIGPDICLLLAAEFFEHIILMGDGDLLHTRARQLGLNLVLSELNITDFSSIPLQTASTKVRFIHIPANRKVTAGIPDPTNVPYLFSMHRHAVDLCISKNSSFAALVTAPTDKGLIHKVDPEFIDLTNHLHQLCNYERALSLFCGDVAWGQIRVAFITMHIPFNQVCEHINSDLIYKKVHLCQRALVELFSISHPRLALCALNPHAGEDGLLGSEENDILNPAADQLRREGVDLTGPLSADSLFAPVILSSFDAVIALYHDQGLAPFKALCFGRGAQLTYGLPFLRSSPDHGTAYTLAANQKVDTRSMKQAIKLAWNIGNKMKFANG